jgi:hypothetical protein
LATANAVRGLESAGPNPATRSTIGDFRAVLAAKFGGGY